MHALALFHKFFTKTFDFIHAHRLASLLAVTESILRGAHLSLTNLGRHLAGSAKVKHKIKRVDRLLGNLYLHQERVLLYKAMAEQLLIGLQRVVLLVDWSPYNYANYYVLKAGIALKGRTITLYEEVHPAKQQQKHSIHQAFVAKLKQIVPANIEVIVVTDAGFTNKWFKLISNQGWHFLGRIPSNYSYRAKETSHWQKASHLLKKHAWLPQSAGEIELAKSNPLACQLVIYRERLSGKKYVKKKIRSSKMEKGYSLSQRNAWILVTSLLATAQQIVKYYKFRMQIEQNFRDTKNIRWGLGLCYGYSHSLQRLEILLLLASIAQYMLWLIGWMAEQQNWHYAYQVHTIKKKRVLSFVYLGQQVIYHQPNHISQSLWRKAFCLLPDFIASLYD